MSKHHSKCTTCRHPCATDEDARFEISEDFRRFNQREDIFSRSFWDSTIRSKDTDKFYQSYGCRSYIYNGVNNLQAHYRWYVTDCF